jgi:hypothetical protein
VKAILDQFDRVHVINIVDRTDRRREMVAQLRRVGAADDPRTLFFPARRPADPGPFPSLGTRGCFESHLAVIRQALADGIERLLLVEDDFDFARDIDRRGPPVMAALAASPWDIFYGASVLYPADEGRVRGDEHGLAAVAPDTAVETASFVGFSRPTLLLLEPFLVAMLGRPGGSPDYGPMHVDGAYSIFRRQHPALRTLACRPALGGQRASRSDIAPNSFLLDRLAVTRPLANRLRRSLAWLRS